MHLASIPESLSQIVSDKLQLQVSSLVYGAVGGGSINDTYQVTINHNIKLFLKVNSVKAYPGLFDKEKNGLELLSKQKTIQVPAVFSCNEFDEKQILLLAWVESGLKTEKFWKKFGEQLARLHHVSASYFGLEEDNYMGALPQFNNPQNDWIEFFIRYRLEPQIGIAKGKHLLQAKHLDAFESLYSELAGIFGTEKPSLVHGDLWSGNYICSQNSEPVLIDPAVYFGHRSMDLGMTTLFGGFDKIFYESYNYHFPFPPNYHDQWDACNLYPLLIHLNLFGTGYLSPIESILRKFM